MGYYEDQIESFYISGIVCGVTGAPPSKAPERLEEGRALALGAIHGALREGYPLTRAEVLAEVARLGAAPPGPMLHFDADPNGRLLACDANAFELPEDQKWTANRELFAAALHLCPACVAAFKMGAP
jgi:hypothetical protein